MLNKLPADMIARPAWLDNLCADGPSTTTAKVVSCATRATCAGTIGDAPKTAPDAAQDAPQGKLTAVTINGRTVFACLPLNADGRPVVSYEAIYRMFNHVKPGYCLVVGR